MKIAIVQNKDKAMQPMMKVKQAHLEKIQALVPQASVRIYDDVSDEIINQVADADILIMDPLHLHHPVFQQVKQLKWVHSETAGINTLPAYVIKSSIIITNSSGVHPIPIAEHVLGMMLIFERKLHRALRMQFLEKKWIRDDHYFSVGELHGKTLGVVGYGRIGAKVAQLARAFSMEVDAVVRTVGDRRMYIRDMYANSQLKEVVGKWDYVVNCLPLTPQTAYMFDYEVFSKMKPSAYYINIGRGQTTKEEDLIKALKEGKIAGAGLDVFEKEPLPETSPLWNLENVIITPHYSGWTPYYMDRVIDIFCENLKAYLAKEPMPNLVDKSLGY